MPVVKIAAATVARDFDFRMWRRESPASTGDFLHARISRRVLGDEMFNHCLVRAVAFLWVFLINASFLGSQPSSPENALWVAESAGVLKLAATDGHILLDIGDAKSARA